MVIPLLSLPIVQNLHHTGERRVRVVSGLGALLRLRLRLRLIERFARLRFEANGGPSLGSVRVAESRLWERECIFEKASVRSPLMEGDPHKAQQSQLVG